MKSITSIKGFKTGKRPVVKLIPLVLAFLSAISYAAGQHTRQDKTDRRSELLDRLEKGEMISPADIKTCLSNYRQNEGADALNEADSFSDIYSIIDDLPPLQEFPGMQMLPGMESLISEIIEYDNGNKCIPESITGNSESLKGIKEQIADAIEEARVMTEQFSRKNLELVLDEIRRVNEEMIRESEKIREEIRKRKKEIRAEIITDCRAY